MSASMDPSPGRVPRPILDLARALQRAGGRALLVGGWVREQVARRLRGDREAATDDEFDMEVYGLPPARLEEALRRFGSINLVGESFAVYRLSGPSFGAPALAVDVSLPRRDSKVAAGHRGFAVEGDPDLSFEEATRRRDFTVNAMLWDPLTSELLDFWG